MSYSHLEPSINNKPQNINIKETDIITLKIKAK